MGKSSSRSHRPNLVLTLTQAFPYSSKVQLALPLYEEPIELEGESTQIHELPADVDTAPDEQPGHKAARPNKAHRAFRHAQLAVNQFVRRRHSADETPRDNDNRLPLPVIELILAHLDVRDAAEDRQAFYGTRAPARPCPSSADELYDRLMYSAGIARREPLSLAQRVLGSCDPAASRHDRRTAFCVTRDEIARLLQPVIAEMRACLFGVAAFRSQLDLKTEGCDYWLDLTHLRSCVFRLTGYWPHDVDHDLETWAFGLPEDLARLLYPQGGVFDHREMAMNLDEVIIEPGWEGLAKLENILRHHQRYCS